MISGEIEDWQITASSSYPNKWDKDCHIRNARPYASNGKGWCARVKAQSEWIQIDLGVLTTVSYLLFHLIVGFKAMCISLLLLSTDKYKMWNIFLFTPTLFYVWDFYVFSCTHVTITDKVFDEC